MVFSSLKKSIQLTLIFISFLIVSLILWNTYIFFQRFKTEERSKMMILASAQRELALNTDLNADIQLPLTIISNNTNIPMILVNQFGQIESFQNLDTLKVKEKGYLEQQLSLMKKENDPIIINFYQNKHSYIYYRNSDLLNKLSYYPITLILILVLFSTVIYLFFRSNKSAEQNKLWTGMAKETAHQIGTPLSSLMGWLEILRLENVKDDILIEIEKDIHRLNEITDRFSKIGSVPSLIETNIISTTEKSLTYLQTRWSKQIDFHFKKINHPINVMLNIPLFNWVVENIVKNALDAISGRGKIIISFSENSDAITIFIKDNGKGIPYNLHKKIFSPGFTTKKRGWGLGLSLSKRIIEDYHKGKIFIKESEVGVGTTFGITLKKSK
ncbi:MAG TPA: HAMP domain-containing sensor histidine kinase [Flavobacteriaceae bacterium]|nr:HAMP domain-containing histidine kinase [Flavobacteriaceae bacterium]HEX5743680.1 HAMP domain-containing sensor histidine kinase [Flavobacteriaceae bacterium]